MATEQQLAKLEGGVANAPQELLKNPGKIEKNEKQIWIFVIFICKMVATANNN